MTKIQYKSTLLEYDGPQIFEARDRIGGHYIAVAVEEGGTDYRYLVVGTEVEKLRKFRVGEIDLLSLLVESSRDGWYLTASSVNEEQSITILPQQGSLLKRDYLPDPDLYLHDSRATNSLVSEARARNNLVVEIITDPPETETGHRIRVSTLTGLLRNFQSLVFQACCDQFEEYNHRPTDYEIRKLVQMDVIVPAAAGSFRMLLESSNSQYSHSSNAELASALDIVDNLFASIPSVQQQMYTPIHHRSLNQFIKLLKFLSRNKTNLNYAWAEPNFERPRCSSVSTNQIGPYIASTQKQHIATTQVQHIANSRKLSIPTIQTVTLVGEIEYVDRTKKMWGLCTSNGSILTGVVDEDGSGLNGLTVGERYEFVCLQEISEQEDTQTKYVMKNYKHL